MMKLNTLLKLSCLGITVLWGAGASANSCSVVNIVGGELDDNTYIAEIVGHNGKTISIDPKKYRAIARGDFPYYLEEGEHTFSIKLWKKRQYIKHKTNLIKKIHSNSLIDNRTVKAKTKSLKFFVNILGGKSYDLKISTDKNNTPIIVLDSIKKQNCSVEDNSFFAAKSNYQKGTLPQSITERWSTLASIIQQANPNIEEDHYLPINYSTYLGFTSTDDLAGKKKVTFIAPHTFAQKIGLKVNDVIISLGDKRENADSDNETFIKYFQGISMGENLSMEINRNGSLITLSEKYMPDVIPEVTYKISSNIDKVSDVINTQKLAPQIFIAFNQLLLETADSFLAQGLTSRVSIEVPTLQSTKNFKMNINLESLVEMRSYLTENKSIESMYQNKQFYDGNAVVQGSADNSARLVESMAERRAQ